MILKNKGEVFEYAGTRYVVGERVIATSESEYEDLIGTILQIRNEEDKETDNDTPDIYCSFDEPILKAIKEKVKKRFSKLWNETLEFEDINIEYVVMAPDMIVPLDEVNKSETAIYALIKDTCVNFNTDTSVQPFADIVSAHQQMEIELKNDFCGGMLDTDLSEGYVFKEDENSYECYLKDSSDEWRYYIHIEEQKLNLCEEFIEKIGILDMDRKLINEFKEQIENWDEVVELTNEEYIILTNNPEIPDKMREELAGNSILDECYHESICEVSHNLVEEMLERKKKGMKNNFKIKGFNGKEFELKAQLHLEEVTDYMGEKQHNIGISFTSIEDGVEEPFATFTLNFGEFISLKNTAYVDTNNCWFADELLEKGIAKDTGLYKVSGMCRYPLWQFTEEFLKAVNEEVYKKYSDEHDKYMREAMPDFCDDEEEDV